MSRIINIQRVEFSYDELLNQLKANLAPNADTETISMWCEQNGLSTRTKENKQFKLTLQYQLKDTVNE